MWVGTNDNQGIYGGKGLGEATSPAWMKAYDAKVQEIVSLCRKYKAGLMFMSPPVMQEEVFDGELKRISSVIQHGAGGIQGQERRTVPAGRARSW